MFIDARGLPDGTTVQSDLCIVGAGAAGIALAHELRGQPFRVCLLESGGFDCDDATQSLYEGQMTGRPGTWVVVPEGANPLSVTRLRCFGGTTNIWGGFSRLLDDVDFEVRDGIPYSGWPFPRSHLLPFYARAHAFCRLGTFSYDVADWETAATPRLPLRIERVITRMVHVGATRFGMVYRQALREAANVSTYLYANVVGVRADPEARRVTHLDVATLPGSRFRVRARMFILATGGIENARLLLASNDTMSAGLGNHSDWVGRCFMEHQAFEAALFLPSRRVPMGLYEGHDVRKGPTRGNVLGFLSLSPEILRREELANCTFEILGEEPRGVGALRGVVGKLRSGEIDRNILRHLRNVIADIDGIAGAAYRRIVGRPVPLYRLASSLEQWPRRDSRVTLARARDQLGMNRVQVDWRQGTSETRSMRRALRIIAQELGRAQLGRLRILIDEHSRPYPSHHHMGTTRMHLDPRRGVVDEQCRVHGVSNLFVAGSSVFPTSGSANPTLTIIALAIKLGDHLKALMMERP